MKKILFIFCILASFLQAQTPNGTRKVWADTLKVSRGNQFVDILLIISDSTRNADGVTIVNNSGTFGQKVFNDTTTMKAAVGTAGQIVVLKQFASGNTNGGGFFVWKTSGTADGKNVFAGTGGKWHRVTDGQMRLGQVNGEMLYNNIADTVVFGASSAIKFSKKGNTFPEHTQHQGFYQFKRGISILPDPVYGYSNLNFYYTGASGTRGMGITNYVEETRPDTFRSVYFQGIDVAQPRTPYTTVAHGAYPDSVSPVFILFGAYDTAQVANDMVSIVGNTYDPGGGASRRYRGEYNFNTLGLSNAVFNIGTRGANNVHGGHPSSHNILRLHRTDLDSTNAWFAGTTGSIGTATFIMSDSVSPASSFDFTLYRRNKGSFNYLNGEGFKFQFSSYNNKLEMLGGALSFRGGGLTVNPNKAGFTYPTTTFAARHASTTAFNIANMKLHMVVDTTPNNAYSITNFNANNQPNAEIQFINVTDHINYKGAIKLNTRSAAGSFGTRVKINEYGGIQYNSVATGTGAFTGTATTDTVTVANAGTNDRYWVTPKGTSITSNDVLSVEALSGKFVVHRPANGTSGLNYFWKREDNTN